MTLVGCTSQGADCFLESRMAIQLFCRELIFIKVSNFIICVDSLVPALVVTWLISPAALYSSTSVWCPCTVVKNTIHANLGFFILDIILNADL